jgi:hypothetical protein
VSERRSIDVVVLMSIVDSLDLPVRHAKNTYNHLTSINPLHTSTRPDIMTQDLRTPSREEIGHYKFRCDPPETDRARDPGDLATIRPTR